MSKPQGIVAKLRELHAPRLLRSYSDKGAEPMAEQLTVVAT